MCQADTQWFCCTARLANAASLKSDLCMKSETFRTQRCTKHSNNMADSETASVLACFMPTDSVFLRQMERSGNYAVIRI